jgi:hypothetical protein
VTVRKYFLASDSVEVASRQSAVDPARLSYGAMCSVNLWSTAVWYMAAARTHPYSHALGMGGIARMHSAAESVHACRLPRQRAVWSR